MKLSPQLLSEDMTKYTLKDTRAVWEGDEGEARNHVEVHSQGVLSALITIWGLVSPMTMPYCCNMLILATLEPTAASDQSAKCDKIVPSASGVFHIAETLALTHAARVQHDPICHLGNIQCSMAPGMHHTYGISMKCSIGKPHVLSVYMCACP